VSRAIEGIGIGLRRPFADELLETRRRVDFLEVTPENWVLFGGARRRTLERCLERWPAVLHGVSLSVGGTDPLDESFLEHVSRLSRAADAPFWSDHLCYSAAGGAQLHDLLPLPFTHEALAHVAERGREAASRTDLPLLLENATFYSRMPGAQMDEADFFVGVSEASGCELLLDVNNVFVNAQNHGFDARAFIDRIPMDRVRMLHLAGHTPYEDTIIDTHIGPISEAVWDLYRYTLARAGRLVPTLIEWDQDLPPVDVVLDEVDRARAEAARALETVAA
jgi:hypothetical protein